MSKTPDLKALIITVLWAIPEVKKLHLSLIGANYYVFEGVCDVGVGVSEV